MPHAAGNSTFCPKSVVSIIRAICYFKNSKKGGRVMISGYRSLMTLLAVLTPAFFLINQGKAATLEGTVRNICSHQIVAGATVEAVGATTETTTTDANGFFQFSDLLEGEVALSVSAIGFKSETAIVEVVGEATNADVDLLPISFCEIECDADGDVDGADLGLMAAG